jgi:hypothetical protein
MGRPTIGDLSQWLHAPLADALGVQYEKLEFSALSRGDKVEDGTTVLLLRNAATNQSLAVVLCSPPVSPDMIKRAMDRARQAKLILKESAGTHILDPLAQGSVHGLSYAVLPYCRSLSESRLWWIQRALLRPLIVDWLRQATECTVRNAEPASFEQRFGAPLQHIVSLKPLGGHLRAAASRSIERLKDGAWVPRHALMHGDLWKGNILIRPQDNILRRLIMSDRFVITDWAGSEISGYAIYDLVNLAQSLPLNALILRRELDRHCRLLGCEPADATSYLLAALGHIGMNLEHFPIDRYMHLAESCFAALEHALAPQYEQQSKLN